MASCTQLEKLSCRSIDLDESDLDDIYQCIEKNSESLKCLDLETVDYEKDDVMWMAINKCNKLEELSLDGYDDHDFAKNLPPNLKKLRLRLLKIKDIKVLVARCSKLEDLFLDILCCTDDTCHHIDEVISIIAGSPLSDTLVNLSLSIGRINFHEEFSAKCLELRQMKKLKKIKIWGDEEPEGKEVKDMLMKTLPHLTHISSDAFDTKHENFPVPADPYGKHDKSTGFWEISCERLSCNF